MAFHTRKGYACSVQRYRARPSCSCTAMGPPTCKGHDYRGYGVPCQLQSCLCVPRCRVSWPIEACLLRSALAHRGVPTRHGTPFPLDMAYRPGHGYLVVGVARPLSHAIARENPRKSPREDSRASRVTPPWGSAWEGRIRVHVIRWDPAWDSTRQHTWETW